MGNVIMKAQQITYGASNVEKALDDLNVPELIELNKRMDAVDAWKANVHEETYTGSELTINNALALPARSLITEIEPIQDLHGYDKPWAGGAGKNKWPFGDFNGTYSNVPFSLAAGTYTASKANPAVNCGLRFYYADDTSIAFTFFTSETFTLTADVVKINYSSADATTENFMIESGSTATSFAPYSNICPISGRDSVAVDDVGKNLTEDKISGCNLMSNGGIITDSTFDMQIAKVKQGETYVITTDDTSGAVYGFFTSKPVQGSTSYNGTRYVTAVKTFTAPITGYVAYRTFANYATPQCEIGTTPTPYQPYAHSSATLNLGTTVYDGNADITEGSGDSLTTLAVYDGSNDESWTFESVDTDKNRVFIALSGVKPSTSNVKLNYAIQSFANNVWNCYVNANGNFVLYLPKSINDLIAWRAFLSTTNLQIKYELATPLELTLSPTEVQMLKGYNRVTLADGYGEIELKALVLGGDN